MQCTIKLRSNITRRLSISKYPISLSPETTVTVSMMKIAVDMAKKNQKEEIVKLIKFDKEHLKTLNKEISKYMKSPD